MRKHFSVLAMAIWLGAIGVQAQFVTYDLQFEPCHCSTDTLTGQMTIDTSDPDTGTHYSNAPFPSWFQSLTLSHTSGGVTTVLTKDDFTGLNWEPWYEYEEMDWNWNLMYQFNDINFFGTVLSATPYYTIEHVASETEFFLTGVTPVPEPSTYAAVFAAGLAAFGLYRRFKTASLKNL